MSIEQMRAYVKRAYGNASTWVTKVDKMTDYQVEAIYWRIVNKKNSDRGYTH